MWDLKNYMILSVTVTVVMIATSAYAWGPRGHEQVADIAWTQMKSATKSKIKSILRKADGNFKPLGQSEAQFRRAFRRAANFPDVIKSNTDTSFESIIASENGIFPLPPSTPSSQRNRCKTWHYFDTPILASAGVNPTPPSDMHSTALKALPRAASKLTEPEAQVDKHTKSWYLAWVEHIVGDLHQPLHCAESFAKGTGDGGGNDFKVRNPDTGTIVSLHSLWDGGIERAAEIGGEGLPTDVESVTARWLEDPLLQPSQAAVGNLDIKSWIGDGATLAKNFSYNGAEEFKKPKKEYMEAEIFLCKKQAVLAGMRLAKMLDNAL